VSIQKKVDLEEKAYNRAVTSNSMVNTDTMDEQQLADALNSLDPESLKQIQMNQSQKQELA
jgi:hypothetical protein